MKQNRIPILAVAALLLLTATLCACRPAHPAASVPPPPTLSAAPRPDPRPVAPPPTQSAEAVAHIPEKTADNETGFTAVVPQSTPTPKASEPPPVPDKGNTCTLSIDCGDILAHMDDLDPEKVPLIPADGVLFPPKELPFTQGESVFDLLLRETKANKIHMEFVSAPLGGSAYIEGLYNLYEFDCGERSGWLYRVNGAAPGYGCDQYLLNDGDAVTWIYTCDGASDGGA